MTFQPSYCPCGSAACKDQPGVQFQRRGTFTRACDGRIVQRFQCKRCKRTFSTQTFRVDRGLRKPAQDQAIFRLLISKVTQRQITRAVPCNRKTVARRIERWGVHCREFHEQALLLRGQGLPWEGNFLLDELETHETDRRLKPVTVPLLVHKPSHCILHVAVGTLPARQPLSEFDQRRLEKLEALEGKKRTSESVEKVTECFEVLASICPAEGPVRIATDEKPTYGPILKEALGDRVVHERTHSKVPRNTKNPLFVVNHTFAMLRDGLSRLVRRNWAHSKEREKLEWHLWIYIAWRNYV